jgi:A/G-specific adenine glycosylase
MQNIAQLHHRLFNWWHDAGRVLPWREKEMGSTAGNATLASPLSLRDRAFQSYMAMELRRDPYRVVVAEMMLQQTQVDRVLPKYLDWMAKWPQIGDLAKAELSEVLIFWQGLGYNRRARFLWLLAKEISQKNNGIWPQTEEELLELPGIGRYTARAILSFAFGQHTAVVDTNVKRVLRRVIDGKEAAEQPTYSEREWFVFADQILPPEQADPWNQLVMDLGALVCTARGPQCEKCPVKEQCAAQQKADQLGFSTYREFLLSLPKAAKNSAKPKTRFEDTDRFFRGRIMDTLRQAATTRQQLWQVMQDEYGLADQVRFETLLTKLAAEGLIQLSEEIVQLG